MDTVQLSRRSVLQMTAGVSVFAACSEVRSQSNPYLVLTLSTKNFPLTTIAGCSDLERTLVALEGERVIVEGDLARAGTALRAQALAQRADLRKQLANADKQLADATLDQAFAAVNLGLVAVFATVGLLVGTSPVALGLAAGATVLSGVGVFAVQLIYKGPAASQMMVVGYGKDRALMFTELALESAQTAAGKLAKAGLKAAGWFVGAYELANATGDKAKALADLKQAVQQLRLFDQAMGEMGESPIAWGALKLDQLKVARAALKMWIDDTRSFDCRFKPPLTGAILRKP